ncbi:MAG: CPBP family intramembrane metalloprotease [Acidobacteria bacterium]|nr:CPBP family intramembrane metalloprotease [Acidobacteriota bacterium]MBS1864293.1 CPBP family intramembrane metalloprotease [Acidobacteriota bacterium]
MPWDFLFIFFVLIVIVPWRGWARLQRLLALPYISSRDRILLYLTSITTQWIITALVAWRSFARGLSLRQLGLNFKPTLELLLIGILGGILISVAHWFNLRRVGRSKNPAVDKIRALAAKIFPHSNQEAFVFCGLAVTAGICEEFLYRGFVFAALSHLSVPAWAILFISSVMFGLAHAYQGRSGMIGTLLLGTVFGSVRILYDSLVPIVFWHAAVDIVAGFAGKRYLIENK